MGCADADLRSLRVRYHYRKRKKTLPEIQTTESPTFNYFMKRLLALLVLAGMSTGAMAQQGGQTMTLDQCIQYALENSVQAKNALLDQEKAKYRVKEITGMGLPQI